MTAFENLPRITNILFKEMPGLQVFALETCYRAIKTFSSALINRDFHIHCLTGTKRPHILIVEAGMNVYSSSYVRCTKTRDKLLEMSYCHSESHWSWDELSVL